MDKERALLNPKKVGEIYGVLSPTLTVQRKGQFIGLAGSLGACWKQSYGLKKNIDELVIPASQDLQYAEYLY